MKTLYILLDLSYFAFQFLGIFFLALVVLLVGTNRERKEELKKPGESVDCVQIKEGRGFKCHLLTDQGIGTCLEDEV
jgi:hypothetical protein